MGGKIIPRIRLTSAKDLVEVEAELDNFNGKPIFTLSTLQAKQIFRKPDLSLYSLQEQPWVEASLQSACLLFDHMGLYLPLLCTLLLFPETHPLLQ